ncbi:MAG: MAPEG family protein [Paracoccaceae bacterium]
MSLLPVTALYAGALTLWLLFLTAAVVVARRRHKVSLGDGDVPELRRRVRAHANAAEQIPPFLIALALSESLDGPNWLMHLFGLAFTAGRLIHGWHFLAARTDFRFRMIGQAVSMTVLGLLAVGLVAHGLADLVD